MKTYSKFFRDYPSICQACHSYSKEGLTEFLADIDEAAKGDYVGLLSDKRRLSQVFFKNRKSMAKRTFKVYRTCFIYYMKWKNDEAALALISSLQYKSLITEDVIKQSLFRSYVDMISYIDSVGFSCSVNYTSDDALDIKAIATLLWIGLSHTQIAQIKVSDLNEYCVVKGEQFRKSLTPQQYSILVRYSKLETQLAIPECTLPVRIPRDTSDMLFLRSIPYVYSKLRTRNNIPHTERIDLFNCMVHKAGYEIELKQTQLRKNAAFEYVKFHKDKNLTLAQSIEAYGYNKYDAYNIVADYKVWDSLYYPKF